MMKSLTIKNTDKPKSKRGAQRQYNAILNKVWKAAAGGTAFGMDWITLAINDRANYDALKHLEAIYPSLPD